MDLLDPGGGGEYSDMFIHTLAGVIFGVQNIEFQFFFFFWGGGGGFRKINISGV